MLKDLLRTFSSAPPLQNGGKHARLIDFEQRSVKEVQKNIKSLDKQIVKHQDKIANPSKYCAEWDTMDPRRKNALINKRWPAEILCFTEERDILQTTLVQIMKNKNFETYIKYISDLLKYNAKKAKLEADNPKEGESDYNTGYLMAYYEVISTMKNQASIFDLEQEDLSLSDIEPDRDLV